MQYKQSQLIPIFLLSITIILLINNTNARTLDEIIAIIDENIILESDIRKKQQMFNKTDCHKKNNEHLSNEETLNQLITDTIILQLAQKANIHLDDSQINNIIHYIAEKNNMTIQEFKTYLLNNNINYTTYKNYIKNDAIISTICDYEMNQRIKISPYELHTLTKELILTNNNIAFQLDHILIPIEEHATHYQIKKAHSLSTFLIKEMQHGINIKQLIELYSNNNKFLTIQTNKIPWSTIQELPTLFSEHLIKEKIHINKIIGPIYSNIGFHILKIDDIDNPVQKNTTTKVHVRNIFIKTSNINNDQKIKKKLLKITKQIANGDTTFSIEAQQISEDPSSSHNGGDLGWKYLDDFEKIFQHPIQSLQKGEITQPIKTTHGWHLIQLIDSKKIDKNKIFYQENAYQIIFNKKLHDEMKHWTQELKTLTYINILKHYDQ